MDALGAGLLSAFGNFGLGIGGAMETQRKEAQRQQEIAIAQQRADQEQQYRDALITIERDKMNQAAQGVQLPAEMGGGYSPKELLPFLFAKADAAAKRQEDAAKLGRETEARLGQAAELERMGAGRPAGPAILAGQLAPGEDPEAAALIPRIPSTPEIAANPRFQEYAALLRYGPLGEVLAKALVEPKRELVPETTAGYFEGGKYTPIPRDAAAPPPETPGLRNVLAVDKNGRPSWTQQVIGVGSDREAEAVARGYRSFAEAPQPVQTQINTALDTQGLRRSQQQGVEAARLAAKPLTEEEAKAVGGATAALGAVREIQNFSPDQIGQYVGLLNRPVSEARQVLAGMGVGGADTDFINFKSANARLQATMFDTAGKAVTENEKKIVTGYIPTGDEPNAATYLAKLRGFEAYTRVSRDIKLEMTRTGRGAIDPNEYDRRLTDALARARVAPATPAAGGGSADERARRKYLGQQ